MLSEIRFSDVCEIATKTVSRHMVGEYARSIEKLLQ